MDATATPRGASLSPSASSPDDGDPDASPVNHTSSGRVNRSLADVQLAPLSADACTAGRGTGAPLYGAAAPVGGGAGAGPPVPANLGPHGQPLGTRPRDMAQQWSPVTGRPRCTCRWRRRGRPPLPPPDQASLVTATVEAIRHKGRGELDGQEG